MPNNMVFRVGIKCPVFVQLLKVMCVCRCVYYVYEAFVFLRVLIYMFIMLRSYITDICNAPTEGGWFGVRFAGHEIS